MNSKLQDVFHWILVAALTGTALEPMIKPIIPANVDAILAAIFATATMFVYYADNTSGTTPPTNTPPAGQ